MALDALANHDSAPAARSGSGAAALATDHTAAGAPSPGMAADVSIPTSPVRGGVKIALPASAITIYVCVTCRGGQPLTRCRFRARCWRRRPDEPPPAPASRCGGCAVSPTAIAA